MVRRSGFEPTALYANRQPYTIAVTDGSVVDVAHGRTIPIRVRHPVEALADGARLPVVVWVHGGNADPDGRLGSRDWSEALVRAGYVVVHPSILPRDAAAREALWATFGIDPAAAAACGFNPVYVDRPRDAAAVIDALPLLGAVVPALQDRIDLSRIVVAGHSFGAYTARAVAGARLDLCPAGGAPPDWPWRDAQFRDPRPLAFVALSPQGPGRFAFFDASFGVLDRPDFMATGAGDATVGETPADRLRSFELIAPGDKYLLNIDDLRASHAAFNLNDALAADFEPWLVSAVIAFVDAHAKGDPLAQAALRDATLDEASGGVATLRAK
jgi:hypothetical protein